MDTEKPLDYTEIMGVLRATHRDTWPAQTGFGDLINPDGPEAADAIADLVAENERLRAALMDEQVKRGETLRDLPGDTLEKAKAICDLWLHRFEGKPNETIPAHVLAADAVKDIRDGIAALPPPLAHGEWK